MATHTLMRVRVVICLWPGRHQVYWAAENTDCCTRQCCCAHRPFTINIHDPTGKTVLHLTRPVRLNSPWLCCLLPLNCCFLQDMLVTDLNNAPLGRVVQRWSLCLPWFDLRDDAGTTLASLQGPYCTSACFGDVQFNLLAPGSKQPIGSVTKRWSGIVREDFLSNADNFVCVFPLDLPVKTKVGCSAPPRTHGVWWRSVEGWCVSVSVLTSCVCGDVCYVCAV